MKHMKKLVSVLLTMVMVFAMTATAFADETKYTITINNEATGHTYEAYQIFTGDLSEEGDFPILYGVTAYLQMDRLHCRINTILLIIKVPLVLLKH